jgi:LPXTG-motif cell wall-anchored protein
MRKTLGITLTAAALMFGGAGVANATAPIAPTPTSTTTILADDTYGNQQKDSDKTGLWGLAGLLGLGGLLGLKRRKENTDATVGYRGPDAPRA